jgi:hypothetical protein
LFDQIGDSIDFGRAEITAIRDMAHKVAVLDRFIVDQHKMPHPTHRQRQRHERPAAAQADHADFFTRETLQIFFTDQALHAIPRHSCSFQRRRKPR